MEEGWQEGILPIELEAMIFQYVDDGAQLERIAMVCKRWRKFIHSGDDGDKLWKLPLEKLVRVFLRRYQPFVLLTRLQELRREEKVIENERRRLNNIENKMWRDWTELVTSGCQSWRTLSCGLCPPHVMITQRSRTSLFSLGVEAQQKNRDNMR